MDSTDQLLGRLQSFRDQRNWSQFHNPKDLAISVSVEAGELLELFQWQAVDVALDDDQIGAIASEAADIFIYLTLLADRVGFDLFEAAHQKIDQNEQRFPAQRSFGDAKPEDNSERY